MKRTLPTVPSRRSPQPLPAFNLQKPRTTQELSPDPDLQNLARLHGIQTEYQDMAGKTVATSAEALRNVLRALAVVVDSSRDVSDALREARILHLTQCLEPVVVIGDGKPQSLRLRVPEKQLARPFGCYLRFEDRSCLKLADATQRIDPDSRQSIDGKSYLDMQLHLPQLPLGYHHLEYELGTGRCVSTLISSPTRAYAESGVRRWGLFLPLYALRSETGLGAGHLGDWRHLCDWAADLGAGFVGTLPLLAAFLTQPIVEPSPYSPASRLFWNEFYLDLQAIPELSRSPDAARLLEAFRPRPQRANAAPPPTIDYQEQMAARRKVLQLLAQTFFQSRNSERWQAFRQFTTHRPEVEDYARFRAATERFSRGWSRWPEAMRNGKLQPGDFDPDVARYHLFAQWQAQDQITGLLGHCRAKGVQFYLDLPLGVNPESYDVWRHRGAFALGASVGAPPDPIFNKGQNWGFAPPHPRRIREQGYKYTIDYLRFQMRHTGLLRLDHIMGLHRLYWVPKDAAATDGAYVQYKPQEQYAILALESHRNKTTLIGENLGTVPPAVNAAMKRHRLFSMYVLQYEARPDSPEPLTKPPKSAIASLNTHDMPTFTAYLRGDDIQDRFSLGLIPRSRLAAEQRARKQLIAKLVSFLRKESTLARGANDEGAILAAALQWLAASPAELLLVNLEDLYLETQPQNVPGTSTERPNWKRQMRYTLQQVQGMREASDLLRRLTALRNPRPR